MHRSRYDEGPIFFINQDKNIDNSNLRLLYQNMGELEQAKDYYQQALDIQVRALGPSWYFVQQSRFGISKYG